MTAFPNYTQIPSRLPVGAWQAIRVVTLLGALGLALALVLVPDDGALRDVEAGDPGAAAAVARRAGAVAQRLPAVGLQPDAARARAVQGADRAGMAEGVRLRDRRGPVRRVRVAAQGRPRRLRARERAAAARRAGRRLRRRHAAQGEERLVLVDLPAAARPAAVRADAVQARRELATARRASAARSRATTSTRGSPTWPTSTTPTRTGVATASCSPAAFPGLVVAFFTLPEARGGEEIAALYGELALYLAASVAVFFALDSLLPVSTAQADDAVRRRGLLAVLLVRLRAVAGAGRCGPRASPRSRSRRGWLLRTYAKERAFAAQAAAPAAAPSAEPVVDLAAGRSMASHRALTAGAPEVTFEPEGKRVVAKPGMTLLEAAEAAGLPIESGCRMGVCGADPVCVSDGMEHLSAISDDERSTLDRLGFADEHADGVLRARPGAGDDEARAREAVHAVAVADRGLQLRPLRRAGRRARERHRGHRPPPTTSAGATRSRRSTSSPRSRTSSTTAWASPA